MTAEEEVSPLPEGSDALRVDLFGGPRVYGATAFLHLSPLQLALVAVVYGHGENGVERSRAARLVYGQELTADVRQRIRQLLHDVRSRCGSGIIQTVGGVLRSHPQVECDTTRFESLLERGDLVEGAHLARRGFCALPLTSVTGEYVDWCESVHLRLVSRVRSRATARWTRSLDRQDWQSALVAAQAIHCLDPRCQDATVNLIEAHGRTGGLELAESVYAEYMESEPSHDGGEVEEAIRRVRRAGRIASTIGDSRASNPFVGRAGPMASARAFFDTVQERRFGLGLIGGEAGIGKTRLLQELQREAVFRNLRCLSAQAMELESRIPLNPLIDALKSVDLRPHLSALGQPWSSVIGAVLPPGTVPELVGELPPIQESAVPRRLLDALNLLLQQLAQELPTVLFIDDLQWADATTLAALHFIQRRWPGGPFGVMATVRTELVAREEPSAKYLRQSEALATFRTELQELSSDEAMRLVLQLGEGRIDEEQSRRICALAGLHPLYLTELTRDYLNGRLNLPESSSSDLTVPVSVDQILGARLQRLDQAAMRVAGLLAVSGRPTRVRMLASLADMRAEEVADAVETLRQARLVEVQHDRVRISHELFRSAIYRRLGEPRRALAHRAYAAYLDGDDAADALGELAIHYDRAGEWQAAAKYGWLAADRALEAGAVAEAAHFYQLAAENERDAVARAVATAGLAKALHLARDIGRANPTLELAAAALRAVGRSSDALRLEIHRVEGMAETGLVPLSVLTEQLADLKRQASSTSDWEALALALDVELHLLHRAGDVGGIRGLFAEMQEVASRESLEATILANAGLALGVLFGDPEEGLAAAETAVKLAEHAPAYRLRALTRLLVVLHYRGMLQLPTSEPVIREARALAERSGDVLQRFSIESNLAVAALDAGDLDRAEVMMESARSIPGTADMDLNRCIGAINRAELSLTRGDYSKATRDYTEAASYLGSTSPSYLRDLITAGLGLCALESGNLSDARRREQDLRCEITEWHFDPTVIVLFRTRMLERRGDRLGALELLRDTANQLERRFVLAWLKIVLLLVRLMAKDGNPDAATLVIQASDRCRVLCLDHRLREFSSFSR